MVANAIMKQAARVCLDSLVLLIGLVTVIVVLGAPKLSFAQQFVFPSIEVTVCNDDTTTATSDKPASSARYLLLHASVPRCWRSCNKYPCAHCQWWLRTDIAASVVHIQ